MALSQLRTGERVYNVLARENVLQAVIVARRTLSQLRSPVLTESENHVFSPIVSHPRSPERDYVIMLEDSVSESPLLSHPSPHRRRFSRAVSLLLTPPQLRTAFQTPKCLLRRRHYFPRAAPPPTPQAIFQTLSPTSLGQN